MLSIFTPWEGKEHVDIIFFLYVWPSVEEAQKYSSWDKRYETTIHSHPLPCALTVLSGEITERCYQRINSCERFILLCGKQVLHLGEKSVDLNQEPFIHQLLFEGKRKAPAITLHAYGCSSLAELSYIFDKTDAQNVYPESSVVKN